MSPPPPGSATSRSAAFPTFLGGNGSYDLLLRQAASSGTEPIRAESGTPEPQKNIKIYNLLVCMFQRFQRRRRDSPAKAASGCKIWTDQLIPGESNRQFNRPSDCFPIFHRNQSINLLLLLLQASVCNVSGDYFLVLLLQKKLRFSDFEHLC